MYPCKVTVKKGAARSFKSGGAWIYDNEVERIEGDFTNGDLVTVLDFDGYPLGNGFLNMHSKLRVRMMTRHAEQQIDEAFLRQRLLDAVRLRKQVIDTSACRLVFGEADFLPGLTVDKFGDVLVLESLALGMDRMKETVLRLLLEVLSGEGLPIRGVYERSDAKERLKEGMERQKGFLSAPFDTKVEIRENGVRYLVDVAEGQKTGFFLDQKLNRRAIQRFAPGARVLDCFTHTGSFALNAGLAGAREVLGVDASALGVAQATENAALNGLSERVRFETANVFELLPKLEAAKERFELVILDPPAFTKSRETIKRAVKGYRDINLRGMKLVKDGGFLATCSCSHFMDQELFTRTLQEAARGARKRLRQVYFSTQAPDHPILWAAGETYYLKFFIFQVLDEK
ncbi:class I SAM-dependent rRNA methyltransferase [Stomatobaculum longum]|uniref:class I SAM-dependent rRNA methyltransferase n=1 Tax=Stomatobaculum longum TaxID=796942 RepID=UPI0028802C34|nr:class I SAM-dependent rRNA methyltransferase [Stomatobaculum longum]